MRVLVVGASGNIGSRIARRLLDAGHTVRLATHRAPLPEDLLRRTTSETARLDLDDPASLPAAVRDVESVVYAAGKLFGPNPEVFLRRTNVTYVVNIATAARDAGVGRFVFLSFPHVQEGTTPERRATDRTDVEPVAIHARTRLEAERELQRVAGGSKMTAIILRVGLVYGPGVKLFEAARTLLRWHLLAIWRAPTWGHFVHLDDALEAIRLASERADLRGTYNVCDDEPVTIQTFLDELAKQLGTTKPWRLPRFCFSFAGWLVETGAKVLGTAAPINRDIMRMGMTSAVADTMRFRRELLPELRYPTIRTGIACSVPRR